jgi:DNA-binding MarR family transcriptional regulator
MDSTDDASARAMDALRRLVSALRSSGVAASGEPGMSVAQRFALRVIGTEPGISMGRLASRTLTTPSAVSEVVSRLVARDLVGREVATEDHRRHVLRLTPEGVAVIHGWEQTLPERLIKALASMDPVARGALADALEAIKLAGAGLAVAPSMLANCLPNGARRPNAAAPVRCTCHGRRRRSARRRPRRPASDRSRAHARPSCRSSAGRESSFRRGRCVRRRCSCQPWAGVRADDPGTIRGTVPGADNGPEEPKLRTILVIAVDNDDACFTAGNRSHDGHAGAERDGHPEQGK